MAASVLALCGLLALPSLAAAAPTNDNYLSSFIINGPGTTLPRDITYTQNTSGATTQSDVFDPPEFGGDAENTGCVTGNNSFNYGATVWYDIFPDRPGELTVTASSSTTGYKPSVAVMPFNHTVKPPSYLKSSPDLSRLECWAAALDVAQGRYRYRLTEGAGYAVQVGGVDSTVGALAFSIRFEPDTDRDSLLDRDDRCPTQSGPTGFRGCPDGDGDNIPDPDDQCPAANGGAQFAGCPDRDTDNIRDVDDRCPDQRGEARYQGCADTDGDLHADPDDRCPRENASARDRNGDGCLDTLLLHSLTDAKLNGRMVSGGFVVNFLKVTGVPRRAGVRIVVTCQTPPRRGRRRSCGRRTSTVARVRARAAVDRPIPGFHNKRLAVGSRISVRITAPKATGEYTRWTISRRIPLRIDRCMNVGSTRLKRSGCH